MQKTLKILVVRFSSIGDIILATPIIRCIKQQLSAELHFITKDKHKTLIENNPHLDKVYTIKNSVNEISETLQSENYDYIIDLHNNIRSNKLRRISKHYIKYKKDNFKKFLLTKFSINKLKNIHTVDRYFDAVDKIGAKNDNKGLEFYFSENDKIDLSIFPEQFITFAIGGTHFTKKLPKEKIISICKKRKENIILIGGKDDSEIAKEIEKACENVINVCGKYNINESAYIVKNSDLLITHDTGMMHIAAAFKMKIYSVFGGTHPSLGFTPYLPNPGNKIIQLEELSCRPCHRYGKDSCPKGHFKCMNLIDENLFTE